MRPCIREESLKCFLFFCFILKNLFTDRGTGPDTITKQRDVLFFTLVLFHERGVASGVSLCRSSDRGNLTLWTEETDDPGKRKLGGGVCRARCGPVDEGVEATSEEMVTETE